MNQGRNPKTDRRLRHLDDYECIARDLCYPETVIKRLKNAKNDYERDRIMADARKKATDPYYRKETDT